MNAVNKKKYILYLCMFLSSISFFTFFPYLTILLNRSYELAYWQIGGLVGSIALISSCGSWFGGWLADRWICATQIIWANIVFTIALICIFLFEQLFVTVTAILTIGCARLLLEPAIKKELVRVDDGTGAVFRIRYLSLICGAMLGPIISAFLDIFSDKIGFLVAAALYFACFLLVASALPAFNKDIAVLGSSHRYVEMRPIIYLIFIGFILFVGVSQFTTTIPIYLENNFGGRSDNLYRSMLFGNAVAAIALTFSIAKKINKENTNRFVAAASISLAASFICFLYVDRSILFLAAAVVFFTFAEVVLFPLPETLASNFCSEGNRGFVMGILDLRYVAFFVGPVFGGLLLGGGEDTLFMFLCVTVTSIYPAYFLLNRHVAKRYVPEMAKVG